MTSQHRRSVSFVTPFHEFSLRVNALYQSELAVNLRRWHPDHEIDRTLVRLVDVVQQIEAINGVNGPLKQWNMPSSASAGSYHLRQSSRPTSPYTPPRTPSSNNDSVMRIDLQARLNDLRQRLEQANDRIATLQDELAIANASLANAKQDLHELNSNLSDRSSKIANLRETVARQHQRLSRHYHSQSPSPQRAQASASRKSIFGSRPGTGVSSSKPIEVEREDRHGESRAELQLSLELATIRSLLKRKKLVEAEDLVRKVWNRFKDTKQGRKIQQEEVREAQLLFCTVLRETGNPTKIAEARALHATQCKLIGDYQAVKAMSTEDRGWEFSNALGLSFCLAELENYKAAIQTLTECHRVSSLVTPELKDRLVRTLDAVIYPCLESKHSESAIMAFELAHPTGRNGDLPATAPVDLVAGLGIALGSSGTAHLATLAKKYLQHAHSRRKELGHALQRNVEWQLAIIAEREHRYRDAEKLLMALVAGGQGKQQPTDETVVALLAHVKLKLGQYPSAERHAGVLLKKYGLRNESLWQGCHPADTLIQALALQTEETDDHRFWDAEIVWKQVYDEAVLGESNVRDRSVWQSRLLKHAEAGAVLARGWKESCERRGKVPRTANLVRTQVEELRRMAQ